MKTAILVDGPRQGARYPVHEGQTQLVIPIVPEPEFTNFLLDPVTHAQPTFEQVYYALHTYAFFGRYIVVGTVKNGTPSPEDLIEVLLTDDAKEAIA